MSSRRLRAISAVASRAVLRLGLLLTIVTLTVVIVAYGADHLAGHGSSKSPPLASVAIIALIWLFILVASVIRRGLRLRSTPTRWGSDR